MDAEHWVEQGRRHHCAGRWRDAEVCYRHALAINPRHPEALHLLGLIAHQAGHTAEAIQLIRQALENRPDSAVIWNNLATVYHEDRQLAQARACLEEALRLQPNYATAHNNLGEIYKTIGRVQEALAAYRRALECDPNFLAARSNYLMTLLYDPAQQESPFLEEVRRWGNFPVPAATGFLRSWSPQMIQPRCLRVGYVSPDFRKHAVMRFFLPVLQHHNPERVEVYLYAQIPAADRVSEQLRKLATGWHIISLMSAHDVARRIVQDQIHILVDLAGHTRQNRLDVFALQPAPIQCTYLGYPGPTGIPAIHFRIGDTYLFPSGKSTWHTEQVVCLESGFFAFSPPDDSPDVAPSPCLRNGYITFGSHHPLIKLNDQVLRLYKQVLEAVPGARLLFFRDQLRDWALEDFQARLAAVGVPKDRLIFEAPTPDEKNYLPIYHRVDIVLDAFPFTGHTMTCESLWMGVPVLTWSGDRPWHRLSKSVLERMGLNDWVTKSAEEFVQRARMWAGKPNELNQLRFRLRTLVMRHLANGAIVAQALEDLYQWLWHDWRARQGELNTSSALIHCQPQFPDVQVQDRTAHVNSDEPQIPEAWNHRGLELAKQKRFQEARECFRRALELQPNYKMAELNLGMCYKNLGYLEEAARIFQECVDKYPGNTVALIDLAATYKQLNRLEESLACLQRACQVSPPFSPAWHNFLVYLNYCPSSTPEGIFQAHDAWGKRAAVPLLRAFSNAIEPERPLRIGYVSPDLSKHPLSQLVEPILRHHKRPDFTVYVYAAVSHPDAMTRRLKTLADYWRDVAQLSPEQIAAQIRADRIDILVDLAGHYPENCLAVFAQQPAPVQLTWLGYPHTTGLSMIHYRLTDRVLNPLEEPPYATERLVYLDGSFSCFQPPDPSPDIVPSPCLKNGVITFGSYHDLNKLNNEVSTIWSAILKRVPNSRLLFFRSSYLPPLQDYLKRMFNAYGIESERIVVRQPGSDERDQLSGFAEVDIVLDTFPFGGHSAAYEALWMGVPLITLYGKWPAGRRSASVLTSIGATEWIARSPQEYIEIACQLAGRPEELASQRRELRQRLEQALGDGSKFVRQLEDRYRRMWREYCRTQGARINPDQGIERFLHPQQAQQKPNITYKLEDCLAEADRFLQQGRYADAELAYRRIVSSEPRCVGAWRGLGRLAALAGHLGGAAECLNRAIQYAGDAPQLAAQCHFELAQLYQRVGRLTEALEHAQQAVALQPGQPLFLRLLGSLYFDIGASAQAADAFRAYLEHCPDDAEVWNDLGNAYRQLEQNTEALASYRRALALKPNLSPALANIANLLAEEGKTAEAQEHYYRAYLSQPLNRLRFLAETTLPVIYLSLEQILQTRATLQQSLQKLVAEGLFIDPTQELFPTHFYLAYQGMNDRELHELIARLGEGPRKLRLPELKRRTRGRKIKIGFLSRYLQTHTIGQLNLGLITELDRQRFEVYVLSLSPPDSYLGQRFREIADHYIVLPPQLPVALQQLASLGLDILYFPDIGMDAMSYTIAFSRLAPIQCCSWGHPVTTGLPSIDYFVSSDTAEIAEAQEHYSERLVRLSRLNVVYKRPQISGPAPERQQFGLPERGHIYLCPQTLFKFHPEYDALLAAILRRDPEGWLVLIEGKYASWTELLLTRFRQSMPDVVDRVRFVKKLPRQDFLRLMCLADVMLDPIHFGGGNTSYEAFALGVPIVTWPSQFLRCRLTYAMYRQMGFLELVAGSPREYVEKTVRVATDRDYREHVRQAIWERCAVLYDDRGVVRELEEQFIRWLAEQ